MIGLRVLELRVREAAEALDEKHDCRDAGARHLGRVMERSARQPVRHAGDLFDCLVGELDQLRVEKDRLDAPDLLPFDLYVFLRCETLACLCRLAEHGGELDRVQVALVEEYGAGLHDGGDDPGTRDAASHRAHRSLAGPPRDLADLERKLRSRRKRVASLVHRRRARVRGLAAEGDLVAFDAEGAEDDSEREVHGLEHGPLLDVELEIGGRALELTPRFDGTVQVDAVPGERIGEGVAVRVPAGTELVLVGHRAGSGARAEKAAPEARSLLVRPVDEADGHRRRSLLGDPADDLDPRDDVQGPVEPASVWHGVDVAADEKRAVGGPGEREPLVSGLVRLLGSADRLELSGEPLPRADPRIRPRDALCAVLVACELSQLLKLFNGTARPKRHGGQLYKLPGLMGRGSRPIKRWRNDRQRKKKERDRRRATEKKTK